MFLETKLHTPKPKPNLLVRERLLCLVHDNMDKRLIAVISGAGYGKTTLIGQLLEREQLPAVFMSLDPSDSDPAGFTNCLLTGLLCLAGSGQRSTLDQSLHSALERLRNDTTLAGNPAAFATALINVLAANRAGELFIVLDDYHCLEPGSKVHEMVDYLIDRMPASLHLIIGSREPLPLPSLPKWRSKQDSFELDQSDLAFKESDLQSLMERAYKAALTDDELSRLLEQTRGWIAGIHLVMQAAGMHKSVKESLNGYIAANRPLFEYFAGEILEKEDQPTRDFLIQSSVLEILSGPACDHLLERSGSARLLQSLERRNLFIAETAAGEYRLHPLFQTYLRGNFTDAARQQALHARAADFFQQNGRTEAAIDHCLQAGDFDRAAGLIAGIHEEYSNKARFDTLGRWFTKLPETVYQRFPQLLLPLAWWHLEQLRPEEQRKAIDRAVELLTRNGDRKHLCQALLSQSCMLGHDRQYDMAIKAIVRSIRLCPVSIPQLKYNLYYECGLLWVWKSQYAKAGRYYRKALKIAQAAGLAFNGQVENYAAICALYSDKGDYRTSLRCYHSLMARIKPDHYYLGIGYVYGSAAATALTVGDVATAESFLARGWAVCRRHPDVRSIAMLTFVNARMDFYSSRWDSAEEKLKRVEEIYIKLSDREWIEAVWRIRVQLYRYQNKLTEAQQILNNFNILDWFTKPSPNNLNILYALTIKGYLEVATGRMVAARQMARIIDQAAKQQGDRLCSFYAQMIMALSWLERLQQAQLHFKRARTMARQWGYEGLLALEIRNNPGLRQLYEQSKLAGKSLHHKSLHRLDNLLAAQPAPAPETNCRLSVRFFGQVELLAPSGQTINIPWRTRKVLALFAYLTVNRGRFCHSEELISALWPRTGLDKAKRQLYQTVCLLKDNLKTGLGSAGMSEAVKADLIVHQSQSYRLSPRLDMELDTETFENLWKKHIQFAGPDESSLADQCQQALALYRDGFMISAGDAWCEERRERYYKMYLMILEKLARRQLASHQPQLAIMHYSTYLQKEPFDEHVRLQYWKALLAVGNRKQVHKDHGHYIRMLRKELDQPPGPDISAFLRSLP